MAAATVLDQLQSSAGTGSWVAFGHVDATRVPVADIWSRSALAATGFSERWPDGAPVAMVLGATESSLVALIGAWRAGLTVVSLPDPLRLDTDTYRSLFEMVGREHRLDVVLADEPQRARLELACGSAAQCFDDVLGGGSGTRAAGGGSFVQYTSGSTRDPAGVVLSLEAVAAGISAIIGAIEPFYRDRDREVRICSWLPLSHDMGLIGGCLTAMVGGRHVAHGTGTVLLDPARFVRRPASWLRACSELGATITLSSGHGLELATRVAPKLDGLDLSSLETILVGGEMIRPEVVDAFLDAYAAHGIPPSAVRPSYGLAENTLAVTIGSPKDDPRSRHLDLGGRRFVACGAPVEGTEVRIVDPGDDGVGEIAIRGASLFTDYAGRRTARRDGSWFLTGDLGAVLDGELVPVGRVDDMIVVRGLNLLPADIEGATAAVLGHTARAVAAVPGQSTYRIVVETRSPEEVLAAAGAVREACVGVVGGVAPERLVTVGKRGLPLTASGKVRRRTVRDQLESGALAITASHEFLRPTSGRGADHEEDAACS